MSGDIERPEPVFTSELETETWRRREALSWVVQLMHACPDLLSVYRKDVEHAPASPTQAAQRMVGMAKVFERYVGGKR